MGEAVAWRSSSPSWSQASSTPYPRPRRTCDFVSWAAVRSVSVATLEVTDTVAVKVLYGSSVMHLANRVYRGHTLCWVPQWTSETRSNRPWHFCPLWNSRELRGRVSKSLCSLLGVVGERHTSQAVVASASNGFAGQPCRANGEIQTPHGVGSSSARSGLGVGETSDS